MIIAGVDGCRDGWVVAWGRLNDRDEARAMCRVARDFASVVEHVCAAGGGRVVIAVDMPIGLADRAEPGGRAVDRAARRLLKGRGSSVFSAPARGVLHAATYIEALRTSRGSDASGVGLSRQTWNIVPKIREVDAWSHAGDPRVRVHEVHPELSFAAMNARHAASEANEPAAVIPLAHAKHSVKGMRQRRALLHACGLGEWLDEALRDRERSACGPDDVIDAFACLWTAARIMRRRALPADPNPHRDAMGIECQIWR